jgi:hypothetical protein
LIRRSRHPQLDWINFKVDLIIKQKVIFTQHALGTVAA